MILHPPTEDHHALAGTEAASGAGVL